MGNYWKHFKTVTLHRYWVFRHCCKAGIPIAGLLHDLSKYSPTEFNEGGKYYSGSRSPIDECKYNNGYSMGWLHHKGRNPHHYEYWQDEFDSGATVHIQMPYRYAIEMVCDMLAASKVYNGKDFTYEKFYDYWLAKKKKPVAMHPQTLYFVQEMIHTMYVENSDDCLRKVRSIYLFKKAHDDYVLCEPNEENGHRYRDINKLF
jgi:hypothetical protein